MSSPILERAISGRSRCRVSKDLIAEGSWRVGLEAYAGGRMTTAWLTPKSFLESVEVEYAANGRAKCRADGGIIVAGEVRVAFVAAGTRAYYRPKSAGAFVASVLKTFAKERGGRGYDPASFKGMAALEPEHRDHVAKVLRGDRRAAQAPNPVAPASLSSSSTTSGKRKAPEKKGGRAAVVKKEDGEDSADDRNSDSDEGSGREDAEMKDGDDEDEDMDDSVSVGPRELVWAKHETNPWWPAYVGQPEARHFAEYPVSSEHTAPSVSAQGMGKGAGKSGGGGGGFSSGARGSGASDGGGGDDAFRFVVFFGPRPSWAWVSSSAAGMVPFAEGLAKGLGARSKTAPFKLALKQASAEADRQDADEEAAAAAAAAGGTSGGDGGSSSVEVGVGSAAGAGSELSEYEQQRLANIARNAAFMASLGLGDETRSMRCARNEKGLATMLP